MSLAVDDSCLWDDNRKVPLKGDLGGKTRSGTYRKQTGLEYPPGKREVFRD